MPVRFDEKLKLRADGGVDAKGPLDPNEEMLELCAWVFQEKNPGDAAATEMTTTSPEAVFSGLPPKWSLRLDKLDGSARLRPGPAFAVAVALMKKGRNKDVVWWGHPITLTS